MPVAWGDGMQRLESVPWLCASCGALAILHLPTGKLTATTEEQWEPVRRGNTELWQLIIETRALIRAGLEDAP